MTNEQVAICIILYCGINFIINGFILQMITFLPDPDFQVCAQVLDYRRLGKERLETKWVLNYILDESKYFNHALLRMWKPYPGALIRYGIAICDEWKMRGYKDNQLEYFLDREDIYEYTPPSWLRDERLHSSHRIKLLTKDFNYYSQFNWKEKPDPKAGYFWPL